MKSFHSTLKSLTFFGFLLLGLWSAGCYSSDPNDYPDDPVEMDSHETSNDNTNMLPTQEMAFQHGTNTYTLNIPKDNALNRKLEEEPHAYSYQGNLPAGWREDYYKMFLNADSDRAILESLLGALRQIKPGASADEVAELSISFVQGAVGYDWETYHNIDKSSIRYPYETLFDGTGVCADKTMLLGRLLLLQGYDIAIFSYDRANHMALGIRVPAGYGVYGTNYAFVESTGYTPVGRIPENYASGVKLDARPKVVEVAGEGRSFRKIIENRAQEKEWEQKYGKEFLLMNPTQRELKKDMVGLETEMEELKVKLKKCRGTLPPAEFEACQKIQKRHNELVEQYNQLVNEFNAANDSQPNA